MPLARGHTSVHRQAPLRRAHRDRGGLGGGRPRDPARDGGGRARAGSRRVRLRAGGLRCHAGGEPRQRGSGERRGAVPEAGVGGGAAGRRGRRRGERRPEGPGAGRGAARRGDGDGGRLPLLHAGESCAGRWREEMNGGDRIAAVLAEQGVRFLFTLCGGHISPILVGSKRRGIRVVDVRHEVDAVFAADAVFRLTGVPGVAAVTAGPGCTNTITAVKNAQLAQSAVVLLGGAAATLLKGRGALQDIDQMALIASAVKWSASASTVRELVPLLEEAFEKARSGVPGPVFLECPVDLLYDESLVRQWYGASSKGGGLAGAGMRLYLQRHATRLFAGADGRAPAPPPPIPPPAPGRGDVRKAASRLRKAKRPVLVLGGQVLLSSSTREKAEELARAIGALGAPVYLAGGARGLLGSGHALQLRHKRKEALREADLVLLAGIPNDFRLDYGRHISRKAFLVSVNRSAADLRMNRKPDR